MRQQEDWGAAPVWSGVFYQFGDDGLGVMAVHVSDTVTHRAPEGWTLESIETHDDSEVYLYRKVSAA